MCDIPDSSYSAKGLTENYRVKYGDAMETFNLSVRLENIRIGTSLDILVTQQGESIFSCTLTCYLETMPLAGIVKNQSKAVYRAEDGPAYIRLKMSVTR